MFSVVAAMLLSQYVRSHVDRDDPTSQCLWWKEGSVIQIEQSAPGNPETPAQTEFAAVTAAFSAWSAQLSACGSLRFEELAHTTGRTIADDGKSQVLFRQVDCDELLPACTSPPSCGNERDCWEHANGALAITTTSYNLETGRITDSDVELNTPRFIFTTVDFPRCVSPDFHVGCVASDVQNTMTHEFGHVLGLSHAVSAASTMNASALPGETSKRSLDSDSRQFVCDVYPADRPTARCLLPAYDGELGKARIGCATTPAGTVALLGLLLLRRARQKRVGFRDQAS